ncbi:U-box domain-containing protein 34-like [Hevea brasiliensis]|uniref:U-box domain-containing protein 34-like n=1 Tax=Hevea brasiliensis TaxID=3981 RepID=UPI0025D40E9B|nr:U-box domain-containing protein 34-like [Hevea brasiliensis]
MQVDILSSMRHPHMIILLGACPEYGCLVHEFMENGSLEDRLFRKYKTPQIPWRARLRIAFEIATAILFLHKTKLELLVHRDLKPANILLDHNFVSKISDVGLARLLPSPIANNVSHYHMTAAAGTFYHIDPEYQQTGMLVAYSKTSNGLSYHVQDAINNGTFPDMLDKSLTDWPVKEALSLAKLAVKCCELRKKNRPDLASVVLLELKRLRSVALENEVVEHETINTTMQSY